MKIAVDGYELNSGFTGVGRFLQNLILAIAKIDTENSYTLFLREDFKLPGKHKNINKVILESNKTHTRWQNTDLRRALNRSDFDIFFSPNHSVPIRYKGFSLMTIPDVSWKGVPGDFSIKERLMRDLRTRLSIKKCPLIFTISEFSKSEIIKHYNVRPEKIVPIHLGIENKFKKSGKNEIRDFRKKYSLGKSRTIGFLGSMFKRRNIQDLIDAFTILKKDLDVKLFLAGADLYKGELQDLSGNGIIYVERLPEEEINAFYSSLDLFIYLSGYEGFGFPPLEALSCGTPSLLLDSSSLGEVYNGLSFFTNYTSPHHLSGRIRNILLNGKKEAGIYRKNFKQKREYFSWERTALEFLKIFNTLSRGDG